MPIVDERAVSTTPLRFADHIDAATRAAARAAFCLDATTHTVRALAAARAGNVAEFERCLRFAADSAALASRLGATDAEVCGAIAAAQAEAAR